MKKIFKLSNIIIFIIGIVISMFFTFLLPYGWEKFKGVESPKIFSWTKLGIGLLVGIFLGPLFNIYLLFKKPKNNQGKLASSHFLKETEYKKAIKRYKFNKKYQDGFVIKTILENKNSDLSFDISHRIGHSLIIGSTNSGKTSLIVDPQIRILGSATTKPTMFISDPKGELFQKHSKWLVNQGYEVVSINLRDELKSSYWNPLEKIWNTWKLGGEINIDNAKAHLSELAAALFPTAEKGGNKDSFFEGGANTIFQWFALAILELSDQNQEITLDHFNITNILNNIQQTTDEELEIIIDHLPQNSSAMQVGGRNVKGEAKQTLQNLFQTVITSLKIYSDPIIKRVTAKTDIKIDNQKSQAIFIIVPDETKAKYPFISLFVSETYKELIRMAYELPNQKLTRPVYYLLDEFGNLPKIPSMDAMLTVSRSRNIYFMLIVQDYAQLNQSYGTNIATTIRANCAIEYFILTGAHETAKKFSDKLGDKSLITSSKTYSSNQRGISSSQNQSERTRRLIHANELMDLEFAEMVIKIQRLKPIKLKTAEFFKWKRFLKGPMNLDYHTSEVNYDQNHFKLLSDLFEKPKISDNQEEIEISDEEWRGYFDNMQRDK